MFLLVPLFTNEVIKNEYSNFSFFIRFFTFFLLFFMIIGIAYFVTKFVGSKSISFMNQRNIRIIERVSLGLDKSIILINIDTYYYMIACSKNNVELIDKFDFNQITIKDKTYSKNEYNEGFNFYLNKYFSSKNNIMQDKNKRDHQEINLMGKLAEFRRRNVEMEEMLKDEEDKDENQ